MEYNEIIWKAIDTQRCKVIGRGIAPLDRSQLNNILRAYQNETNSIILEIYEKGCTEKLMEVTTI